jgi:MFS transporter, SP family, galactose:H+ symporter
LNVLIAGTAAIIGIIYGYDLGSIASAILFLQPDLGLSTFMVSVVTATVVLILAFALGPSPVLAFVGILLFVVGFNFGYGSLVWIYASESFPARLRTQGGSAMLTSDLLANIIVGVVFLNALGALGGAWTFAIFLALAILSLIFIYRLAPETKGRQLESIRMYWYNGGRWPEEPDGRTRRQDGAAS